MPTAFNRNCVAVLVLLIPTMLVYSAVSFAEEASIQIQPLERWTTAFGGDELVIRMRIVGNEASNGRLTWSHAANLRTLAQGEIATRQDGGQLRAEFALHVPPVRDGIIFPTVITTEFVPDGKNEPAATLTQDLILYPRNPLANRTVWAEQLDIKLFDPLGNSATIFDRLKLPYRWIHNPGVLNSTEENGVLIIGESLSLVQHRTLAQKTLDAATAGRRVILLAPSEGSVPLPGNSRAEKLVLSELLFRHNGVITELDKRLDANAWRNTADTIPANHLTIQCQHGQTEAVVTEHREAWPWLEIRFPENEGVLIVCGFQIIRHWENGPTPRYLLIRLLEQLSSNKT